MGPLMRALLIGFALAVAASGAKAGDSADVRRILDLEHQTWDAWKRHDLPALEHLTAPDYYSVSEDGPDHAIDLAWIRDKFPHAHLRDYRLGKIAARVLTRDSVVLVYNAHLFGDDDGKDFSRGVSETSVWVRRNGAWRNVLLHEVTRATRDAEVDP